MSLGKGKIQRSSLLDGLLVLHMLITSQSKPHFLLHLSVSHIFFPVLTILVDYFSELAIFVDYISVLCISQY